jgi:translation elongation factor EF-Ts
MEIQPTGCVPDHLNKDRKNRNYNELDQSITKVILIFDLSKVEAAKKIVRDVTARSNATIRDLLKSLRDSLREKLKLERAELLVLFFRLKRELP